MREVALIDTRKEPALAALTRVARLISRADAAAIHLFDGENAHRVAAVGAPLGAYPAGDVLCARPVASNQQIVVADATQDDRFAFSSFVQGDHPVRLYAAIPIRDGDRVFGTLCVWDEQAGELSAEQVHGLEDLALQAQTQLHLAGIASILGEAASRDALTGVANRLILEDRLAQALERRARHGTEVLVVITDIDNFKAVNDLYGHVCGDQALQKLAQRLLAAVRTEDTVGRLGGDEFVVVAELSASAAVPDLINRLNQALRPTDGLPSVTVGTALAVSGDDVAAALERADQAMYASKRLRRDAGAQANPI
jgi:diguanylate cyclase (GGDEF)-like protein